MSFEELRSAYEGVEDLASFSDSVALTAYRDLLLQKTTAQRDFLLELLPEHGRLLEVGSGNGRLLISLTKARPGLHGVGYDLSRSRVAFASAWCADEALENVRFVAGDVFAADLPAHAFAGAMCISGAFGYFDTVAAGMALQLLRRVHDALEPGGLLCLELYPHPATVKLLEATGGTARMWDELREDDPWRFYLSRFTLVPETHVLTHEKTFVHRSSGEVDEGRMERLKLYTVTSLEQLLAAAGFHEMTVFGDWRSAPYDGGDLLVAVARTPPHGAERSSAKTVRIG